MSTYSTIPKSKLSSSYLLKAIVSEFVDGIFPTNGKIPFCMPCETKVVAERKFTVLQHVGREKHIRAMHLASKKKFTQLLLQKTAFMRDIKSSVFHKKKNLFEALVSANILFWTLNNAKLNSGITIWTSYPIRIKYAPVVSADVEKSFSRYKDVLSDNRRSLTFDNLCKLVVVYCKNAE